MQAQIASRKVSCESVGGAGERYVAEFWYTLAPCRFATNQYELGANCELMQYQLADTR